MWIAGKCGVAVNTSQCKVFYMVERYTTSGVAIKDEWAVHADNTPLLFGTKDECERYLGSLLRVLDSTQIESNGDSCHYKGSK